ncbi:MAG: four helix bundle protein [Actinomycetota bacterium]
MEEAHVLAMDAYRFTDASPNSEKYGLISQMQRSAVSIPTDIAEGSGRFSDRNFARFVAIAIGSSNELEYLLLLSGDMGLGEAAAARAMRGQVIEVRRMLLSLHKRLRAA